MCILKPIKVKYSFACFFFCGHSPIRYGLGWLQPSFRFFPPCLLTSACQPSQRGQRLLGRQRLRRRSRSNVMGPRDAGFIRKGLDGSCQSESAKLQRSCEGCRQTNKTHFWSCLYLRRWTHIRKPNCINKFNECPVLTHKLRLLTKSIPTQTPIQVNFLGLHGQKVSHCGEAAGPTQLTRHLDFQAFYTKQELWCWLRLEVHVVGENLPHRDRLPLRLKSCSSKPLAGGQLEWIDSTTGVVWMMAHLRWLSILLLSPFATRVGWCCNLIAGFSEAKIIYNNIYYIILLCNCIYI